jgi:hypothetical protein
MVKDNVVTLEVHQRRGLSALFQLSNSSNETILTCQCMQGHVLARDIMQSSMETAQLGGLHSEKDNSLG